MAHTVLVPWHLIFCRARFTPMNLASERNNHFALLIIGMNVLTQIAQANSLWISNFNTDCCIKDSEHHVIGYSDFVVLWVIKIKKAYDPLRAWYAEIKKRRSHSENMRKVLFAL